MKFNLNTLFISLLFALLSSCSTIKKKRFIEIQKDTRIESPVLHYTVGDQGLNDIYTYHIVVDYDAKDTVIVILPNSTRRFTSYDHRVYSSYEHADKKAVKKEIIKHQKALNEYPYKWTVGEMTFYPHYFGKGNYRTNPFGTYKSLDTSRSCELVFSYPNCFVVKESKNSSFKEGHGVYTIDNDTISFTYGSNQADISIEEKAISAKESNVYFNVKNHFGYPAKTFVVTLIQNDTLATNRFFVFNESGEYIDVIDGEDYRSLEINNTYSSVSIDISNVSRDSTYEVKCTLLESPPGLANETRKYAIAVPNMDELTILVGNDSLTLYHFW